MTSGRDHDKRPWGGSLAMMAVNRHPTEQGWTPPPAGPRCRPGVVLLYDDDCLGLLLIVALISAC
jgi:hypothetical protein